MDSESGLTSYAAVNGAPGAVVSFTCARAYRVGARPREEITMFGSRKRKDAEAIEALRAELSAAELRSRAMLADAIAKMELRSSRDAEERQRMQTVTTSAVETLQTSLTDNTTEIARALGQVANMCALVAEAMDADRRERRAFTEAIARAGRPPVAKVAGPSEIIGGTFFATSEVPVETDISIVDTDGDAAGSDDATDSAPGDDRTLDERRSPPRGRRPARVNVGTTA
jgi:hypothetical protein